MGYWAGQTLEVKCDEAKPTIKTRTRARLPERIIFSMV